MANPSCEVSVVLRDARDVREPVWLGLGGERSNGWRVIVSVEQKLFIRVGSCNGWDAGRYHSSSDEVSKKPCGGNGLQNKHPKSMYMRSMETSCAYVAYTVASGQHHKSLMLRDRKKEHSRKYKFQTTISLMVAWSKNLWNTLSHSKSHWNLIPMTSCGWSWWPDEVDDERDANILQWWSLTLNTRPLCMMKNIQPWRPITRRQVPFGMATLVSPSLLPRWM